jgi:hypothetical protein
MLSASGTARNGHLYLCFLILGDRGGEGNPSPCPRANFNVMTAIRA